MIWLDIPASSKLCTVDHEDAAATKAVSLEKHEACFRRKSVQ